MNMPRFVQSIWFRALDFALILTCLCAFLATQTLSSAAQGPAAGARFKIAGIVVNSITAAPLVKARISLTDTADRANTLSIITTENGRFAFTSLNRGKYALQGAKLGFIPGGYEQHEEFSTAIV